jgi:hypothetical protein
MVNLLGQVNMSDATSDGRGRPAALFVTLGQRFGRGVVTDTDVRIPRPGRTGSRGARLLCDCGNEYVTPISNLHKGSTQSCGCLRRERQRAAITKHGLASRNGANPLYKVWGAMLDRCENPQHKAYPNYGGRGIGVCPEWHDVTVFVAWMEANLGPCPPGKSIDRTDNDGNYEPGNVRWATAREQSLNQRRPSTAEKSEIARRAWQEREAPPRTEVCEWCGCEYQTASRAGNLRFCSKKCKAAHRRASGVDDIEIACHVCGTPFTRNRYEQVQHCSKSCSATCQHAGGYCRPQ